VPVPRKYQPPESLEQFRERVFSGVSLLVNGVPCPFEFIDEHARNPGSGPHSSTARGHTGLVALFFKQEITEPIDAVELGFDISDLEIPALYLSVQEASKPTECYILPAKAATHIWSSTP
jgi:hypothetical protein